MLTRTKILTISFLLMVIIVEIWIWTEMKYEQKMDILEPEISLSLFENQPHASSTQADMGRYIKRLQVQAVETSEVSFKNCIVSPTVSKIFFAGVVTIKNSSGPIIKLMLGQKSHILNVGEEVKIDSRDLVGVFARSGFAYSIYAYECSDRFYPIGFVSVRPIEVSTQIQQ